MKRIILILLFCVVASQAADQTDLLDYRLVRNEERPKQDSNSSAKECTKPGPMCTNCTVAALCIGTSSGYDTIIIEECDTQNDWTCFQGQCTNLTNPACDNGEIASIKCNSIGMLPDPFDCTIYHVCAEGQQTDSKKHACPAQHTYDPISTYCKPSATGCPITPPVPYCKFAGQAGALVNKSIYYICLMESRKLVPQLFICEGGKSYINNRCS